MYTLAPPVSGTAAPSSAYDAIERLFPSKVIHTCSSPSHETGEKPEKQSSEWTAGIAVEDRWDTEDASADLTG